MSTAVSDRVHPVLTAQRRNSLIYVGVLLASFIARIIRSDISDDGTPVFDEKHYVTQAYQMVFNGGVEDNPGYGLVVHPPMGKWLIALSESIFGYTPLGWRFTALLCGVIIVACVMVMVHRLTSSIMWAAVAGLLMNLEGITFVMSRFGMLDIFLTMFITLAALMIVMDITSDRSHTPWHRRWYLLASGVFIGMAMAVKISGVYYAAAVGVLLVVTVAITSKSIRNTMKSFGMGLVFFLIAPLTVFGLSWLPWFTSESSPYRHAAEAGKLHEDLPEWVGNILPDTLASFVSYQYGVLSFHTSLTTSSGNLHPWESKPWHWLLGGKPMLFWSEDFPGYMLLGKVQQVYLVGNIAVWALFIPVVLGLTYLLVRHRNKGAGIALAGMLIGYLPWLIGHDRQMYLFYIAPIAPFLVMGIALLGHHCATWLSEKVVLLQGNRAHYVIAGAYVTVALIVFGLYTPWYYGLIVDKDYSESLRLFSFWEPYKT